MSITFAACTLCATQFLSPPALHTQSTMRITSSVANGVLKGTVITDRTERPLLNAKITIPKLGLSAQSDSAGDFRIARVAVGTYEVVVELNGFEPLRSSFNFSDGETIAVDFVMSERVVQYAKKPAGEKARSSVDISRVGLEERRGLGSGRYITPDELAKAHGKSTADFIESRVSGLHANKIGADARALASDERDHKVEPSEADRKTGAKADCYIQVLLNGVVMYERANGNTLFDVNSVPIALIMSADFFTAAQTPPEHQTPGAKCGTLQILTRGR
ncbi:MAG: carboxypeptidase-like regulatory domain-containing protein [Gemmatimonadaceae bacterium]